MRTSQDVRAPSARTTGSWLSHCRLAVLPLRERSILQAFEGILEVLGTAGDSYLGGDDFDVELAGWIEGQLRQPCSREVRAALATALGRIAAQPW